MAMMLLSSYNRYLKDLEQQQINLFDLRLKEIDIIEFPNQISDFEKELTIPFGLQIRAKAIKMKFFILEDDNKPCNISKSIYNLTPKDQYVSMYLSPDESHLSFGDSGKLDLMVPIKAKHVNNGKITIVCEILERKTVRDKIPFEFDVLAPTPGNRNSWTTFVKIDKSFFHVQEVVNVDIILENNGIPSTFFFFLEILDYNTAEIITDEALDSKVRTKEIPNVEKGCSESWELLFRKPGKYLIKTYLKKQLSYLGLDSNKDWEDEFVAQYSCVEILGTDKTPVVNYDLQYPDKAFGRVEECCPKLYSAPSEVSTPVLRGNLIRFTRIVVHGRGKNFRKIVENSGDFVRVTIIANRKEGFIEKKYLQ